VLSAADNELLTRTGPGTPMGEYLRRYWLPVALSRELAEPDGVPLRVEILGEKLLAFRDTQGRVGLIEPACAHRCADLFYGRNEENGIRCIYHGWKYDGGPLHRDSTPPGAAYRGKIAINAHPTREAGELVRAFPRPRERTSQALPSPEFAALPPAHRYVSKRLQQCNWAQSRARLDTAHFSSCNTCAFGVELREPRHRRRREPPVLAARRSHAALTILEHEVFHRGCAPRGWRSVLLARYPVHTAFARGRTLGDAGRVLPGLHLGADAR
jgi:phenylpropionate dioxygenase-like ring-hydroxylating dioxygenase large terminal subunit